MNKFLSIQKAAAFLGVSTQTLRRWERSKKIEPAQRTAKTSAYVRNVLFITRVVL